MSSLPFQTFDGRGEDMVFHLGVLCEPLLIIIYVIEGSGELVVVVRINWQLLDNHEFQFAQLLVRLFVMFGEGVDVVVVQGTSIEQ